MWLDIHYKPDQSRTGHLMNVILDQIASRLDQAIDLILLIHISYDTFIYLLFFLNRRTNMESNVYHTPIPDHYLFSSK